MDARKIEDAQETIKRLEKNLEEQAHSFERERNAIEAGHHEEVKHLKRVAAQEIEETTDTYRREKHAINSLTDEALEELTKVHKD